MGRESGWWLLVRNRSIERVGIIQTDTLRGCVVVVVIAW